MTSRIVLDKNGQLTKQPDIAQVNNDKKFTNSSYQLKFKPKEKSSPSTETSAYQEFSKIFPPSPKKQSETPSHGISPNTSWKSVAPPPPKKKEKIQGENIGGLIYNKNQLTTDNKGSTLVAKNKPLSFFSESKQTPNPPAVDMSSYNTSVPRVETKTNFQFVSSNVQNFPSFGANLNSQNTPLGPLPQQSLSTRDQDTAPSKQQPSCNSTISAFRIQPQKITANQEWYDHIEDRRLKWENHRDFPQQVLIMLNVLKDRYAMPPNIARKQFSASQERPGTVSPAKSLNDYIEMFKGNARLQQSLREKLISYPVFRQVRGDGNCFYRAFVCGYMEMALRHETACYFLKLLFEFVHIKDQFKTNCTHPEYLSHEENYHFLIHRFLQLYTYRVELAENMTPQAGSLITQFFYECINNKPFQFDMYLMIAIKSYTCVIVSTDPNQNHLGELRQQSMQEIIRYGEQCENNEICITSLVNALMINIDFFREARIGSTVTIDQFQPLNFKRGESIALFFRPGHYDMIYSQQTCEKAYPNILNY